MLGMNDFQRTFTTDLSITDTSRTVNRKTVLILLGYNNRAKTGQKNVYDIQVMNKNSNIYSYHSGGFFSRRAHILLYVSLYMLQCVFLCSPSQPNHHTPLPPPGTLPCPSTNHPDRDEYNNDTITNHYNITAYLPPFPRPPAFPSSLFRSSSPPPNSPLRSFNTNPRNKHKNT